MKISILTLFPEMFDGPFAHSIIRRAIEKKIVSIEFINIRKFGIGKHKKVDDKTYGGGVGMVMRVDVLDRAIQFALRNEVPPRTRCHLVRRRVILLDPQGKIFTQRGAKRLSKISHLILVCSHYEGTDERLREMVDEEISIGDYILTGGEIPALVLADSIIRLLPKALGKKESAQKESFQEFLIGNKRQKLLEYPQYTRPDEYNGLKVPKILLSGNHKKIAKWRKSQAVKRTQKRRPDLLLKTTRD